jgi:hypothetical protein
MIYVFENIRFNLHQKEGIGLTLIKKYLDES